MPLDSPNIYRLAYRNGDGLYIDLDLGVHSAQHGGPHADFSFVAYTYPSEWGMRAAIQRYYDLFPHLFVKRIPPEREGTWFFAAGTERLGNPADFDFAFDEHARDRWAWDAQHGIYSMEYSEPFNEYDEWFPHGDKGPHPQPSYDEMIAHLKQGLQASEPQVRDDSRAAFASGLVTKEGKLTTDMRSWGNDGYWYAIFHTLVHPDLKEGMQEYMLKHEYQPALEDSQRAGAPLRGWYLDSVNLSGATEDYSPAHFALPGVRLSANTTDSRATLTGYLADYQFLEWFSGKLHAEGRILFGNGVAGGLDEARVPEAHLFDAMGIESSLKRYLGGEEPRPADYCDGETLLARALMYRKPISQLYYSDRDSYDFNWRQSLFYGVHDGPHFVWTDPKRIEAYRPIARHYLPIIRQLVAARWCPVTYARSAGIWLERFGGERSGPLFITVRNPKSTLVGPTSIELDLGPRGLAGQVAGQAVELISGRKIPVARRGERARIVIQHIDGEDTQVYRFAFSFRARGVR